MDAAHASPGAKLDRKANQIAAFFRPYPADAAAAGVREHIEAFWTPAMCRAIRERAAAGGAGLDPLVIRALLDPDRGAEAPGRHETAGPDEAGQIGACDG